MKYGKVSFGHAEAVFNKLGGEQGIADFLSGRTQVVKSNNNISTLMNIEVGLYDYVELIKMVKKDKTIDTRGSNNVLNWPTFGQCEKSVLELVVVTPQDLGFEPMFESCATYENICQRAEKLGLDKCPSILGMQLVLPQYRLKDNYYVVASKLLDDKNGKQYLLVPWFREKGCELKAWQVKWDSTFHANYKFIFVRRNVKI